MGIGIGRLAAAGMPVAFSTMALASGTMQWQWMSMVRQRFCSAGTNGALPWSVAGPQTLHWNSMA